MRVRGLKWKSVTVQRSCGVVAPHAGAWIEIKKGGLQQGKDRVAPHAGAWIEI